MSQTPLQDSVSTDSNESAENAEITEQPAKSTVSEKPAKRPRDRQATQQRLLDACEHILLTHGPEGIGVNNVVAEAGVGKQLLYRYFNDLPGLVSAWLEQSANWPTADEIVGGDMEAFAQLPLREKFKTIQHNYIKELRKRPVMMRIMASELMHPSDITLVLERASHTIAKDLAFVMEDVKGEQWELMDDLSFVFYCMLNYLCIRSVTSPRCYGMNLKQQKAWQRIDRLIDRLVDSYFDYNDQSKTL